MRRELNLPSRFYLQKIREKGLSGHNTTEKEERTANRGFREMAGFVVVSSVVLLINFSGWLAVLCF